jgi:hypothetical protein
VEGAEALVDALWDNKTIKYIYLSGNKINDLFLGIIKSYLERNQSPSRFNKSNKKRVQKSPKRGSGHRKQSTRRAKLSARRVKKSPRRKSAKRC